jgi:hypothetical protein
VVPTLIANAFFLPRDLLPKKTEPVSTVPIPLADISSAD